MKRMTHAPLTTILLAITVALMPGIPGSFTSPARGDGSAGELWLPPLGTRLEVSEFFDLQNGPYQAGHRGIDLPTHEGDAVRSPASGTVSFVGTVVDRPLISIRVNAQTILSLEPVTSELRAGDTVIRGQPLGSVDGGGHCADACLHLGVRVNGNYVNPLRFLRPRPVLLPW